MNEQPMTGLQLMGLEPPGQQEAEAPEPVSPEIDFPHVMMPVYSWGADCPGSQAGLLSSRTPVIWPYVTGTGGIAWSSSEIIRFKEAGAKIYLVNQGYRNLGEAGDPFLGDEFDVESGAFTDEDVVHIVRARRERQWSTRLYGTYRTCVAVTDLLIEEGLRRSVWWRIADWNLSAHLANASLWGDVYAGQWASPGSNPDTLLPGTSLTLAQADADLNVVLRESTGWQG